MHGYALNFWKNKKQKKTGEKSLLSLLIATFFFDLLYRSAVLDLIAHNPFEKEPPKYLRAKLYHYSYTQYG